MPKGRPVKAETPYKIIVHTNGGRRYASTKYTIVDSEGRKQSRHKHWGTVDDNNVFHPNQTYLYATIEERKKLIFPEGWNLKEIEKLSGNDRRGRIAYQADDVDRQYGATWFLGKVAEECGLADDLRSVFGGNQEIVDDILTMAYFPFIDNLSYNQLEQWQREVKTPSERRLNSQAVTRLCQSITEQNRMDMFRCRAARLDKDELCGVDSTSISTYGFNLVDIRWGKNKEKLPLAQTVEVVVYSLTSHMPVFYMELPGNMPDSRTIEMILAKLERAGFRNLVLITDRGYESVKNIELYISKHQKVLTSVKVGQGDVLKRIKEIDLNSGIPVGMLYSPVEKLFYAQYDTEYSVKGNGDNIITADRMKINLYFSPEGRAETICNLQTMIQEQHELLAERKASGEALADIDAFRRMCSLYIIEIDKDGKIVDFKVDEDKRSRRLLTSGFFASKSIGLDLTALEALDTYSMRDEQEKCFAMQKGPLGQDRLRCWSEAGRHGRMFICFIGLILASYVKSVWECNHGLRKKFSSIESLLAEMRTIRCIENAGHVKFITPFVGAQVEICSAFGFEIPSGAAPLYVSKAKSKTPKRGRPAKPKIEQQQI